MLVIEKKTAPKKIPYLPSGEKVEGVLYQTLATGKKSMITTMFWDKNALVPEHSHEAEQAGYIVYGKVEITADGRTEVLSEGDTYVVLGNVPHSLKAIEDSLVIDVFSPPREDYR